jgi:hypothetical protein
VIHVRLELRVTPRNRATYNALNLCTSINDPDPPYDPVETFSYEDGPAYGWFIGKWSHATWMVSDH